MNILMKYPSRSRPRIFKERVLEWNSLASGDNTIHWLCSFDDDDETMNCASIAEWCDQRGIEYYYGHSKTKIEAINADLDKCQFDFDVLLNPADDMVCKLQDWDNWVVNDIDGDLMRGIWYPDGRQQRVCTHTVIGRRAFDEVWGGKIYHPDFKSVYADDYYQWVMTKRGLLKKVDRGLFQHQWKKENNDELMKRNDDRRLWQEDRMTFKRLIDGYGKTRSHHEGVLVAKG